MSKPKKISVRHLFTPSTWVKIENRARLEKKSPQAVAVFILAERVGLIPNVAK